MTVKTIAIKVKLFAIYQELYQQEQITLDVPQNTTVQDILHLVIQKYPQLDFWQSVTKLAVNLDFVAPDFILNDGDEVALIPPVSGGKSTVMEM